MGSLSWWIKNIVIVILAVFFLSLSIVNLISAYELKNPAEFVMVFFSQCLMLMISVVGVIYSTLQLYYYFNPDSRNKEKAE
jgi:Mlc titration factor MtfA (ptsG expression regulator)